MLPKAIASNSDLAFNFMLENPDRYWSLFMTVTEDQRDALEAECDRLARKLLDARDPKFLSVFSPDILAQGHHLVFLLIARESVRDSSTDYRSRLFGKSRRLMFALIPDALLSFDSKLEKCMTEPEQDQFRRLKRTPYASMMLDPRPDSFGVCAILGINPE